MNLKIIKYKEYTQNVPAGGQHILAQQKEDTLVVYQAYSKQIGDHAVAHQQFGGPHFSFGRMTWIKPNFLWMMYRCGWGAKDSNQRCVLAITIKKNFFEAILNAAEYTSYHAAIYNDHDQWRSMLGRSEVRVQWDPDHDPHGKKLERRAIQLGMKGQTMERFAKHEIVHIEDVTEFVTEQFQFVKANELENLWVPFEKIYVPVNAELKQKLGLNERST